RLGDADHLIDGEVGLDRTSTLADLVGLVRLETVQRELVLLRIDGDRRDAQLGRSAKDADGDFGAVGDEKAAKEWAHERSRCWPPGKAKLGLRQGCPSLCCK